VAAAVDRAVAISDSLSCSCARLIVPLLPAACFRIPAFFEPFGPSCRKVETIGLGAVYGEESFNLEITKPSEIQSHLTFPGDSDEDPSTAAILVLKIVPCNDPDTEDMIEVVSKSFGSSN